MATAVMRSVPPERTALASGISNTFRQVGAVFGVALAAVVFSTCGGYGSPSRFVAGFGPALATLGALCLAAAVTAPYLRVPSTGRRRRGRG